MSYKMPKPEETRKLCPRCGSPLMDVGKYTRCPLCGYSEAHEEEARIAIKYSEPEVMKKKKPELKVFKVTPSGITPATTLESAGVYLITEPPEKIWLWKGSNARPGDVYNAGTAFTKLKTSEKLYSAMLIRVEEGEEGPDFPDIRGKSVISKEMITEAQEALTIEPPPEGRVNIYLIDKGELSKIDQPVFTTGDSYLIDGGNNIWVWIGEKSAVDEKFSAAHLSTVIDVSRRGKPKIYSIDQGSEPKELRILLGGLKIVDKDVAETLLKHVEKTSYEPVLYRISSEEYETINDIIYLQVPCTKDSLDSEDVFLLDDRNNETVYIWTGSNANVKEKVVGGQIARKFETERAGVQKEIFVDEGDEPKEFKKILGIPIEEEE